MPVQSGAHSLHSYYRLYHRSQAPNSPFAHPVPLLENFQAAPLTRKQTGSMIVTDRMSTKFIYIIAWAE